MVSEERPPPALIVHGPSSDALHTFSQRFYRTRASAAMAALLPGPRGVGTAPLRRSARIVGSDARKAAAAAAASTAATAAAAAAAAAKAKAKAKAKAPPVARRERRET